MFFYRLKVTRTRRPAVGTVRHSTTTEHMEALKPEYVGEKVASLLGQRDVGRVAVEPINQAKYIRATRSD